MDEVKDELAKARENRLMGWLIDLILDFFKNLFS
jgi:hypothetical protein